MSMPEKKRRWLRQSPGGLTRSCQGIKRSLPPTWNVRRQPFELRQQDTPQLLHEISDLKRFSNETADLRHAHHRLGNFLAISTGQDHLHARLRQSGFVK